MTILSKILCGFLLLAAIPFFYLSARALKTHETWRNYYDSFDNAVKAQEKQQQVLRFGQFNEQGDQVERGIKQAQLRLTQLLAQRGRVWTGCVPGEPNELGEVNVNVGNPNPHQIRVDPNDKNSELLLYVFEERAIPEGGQYIGAFRVKDVPDANLVTLTPALALVANPQNPLSSDRQQANAAFLDKLRASVKAQRADGSTVTWALYELMPVDNHEAFADLQPDELDTLLGESADEYKQEGRRLRDYRVLFDEYDRLYTKLRAELDAYNTDNAAVAQVLADTKNDVEFCMQQITEVQAQLERMTFEQKSAEEYLADVEARVQKLNASVDTTFASIKKLSEELDTLQKATVKKDEERAARATAQN